MPDGNRVYSSDRARLFEAFIRNQLMQRGYSQKKVCDEFGITPGNFSNFLSGSTHKRCKSFSAIYTILNLTEVQLEEIRDNGRLEIFTPDRLLKQIMKTTKPNQDEGTASDQLQEAYEKIARLEEINEHLSGIAFEAELGNGVRVVFRNSASDEVIHKFLAKLEM